MSAVTLKLPVPNSPEYLAPYREMLDRSGPGCGFASLLWTSRQTQQARFRAIADMIDLSGRVVIDAGCGYGDFARHLIESKVPYARYVGIEALEEHTRPAREANFPRAQIVAADFVADAAAFEIADARGGTVIVFSGSLNTLEAGTAMAVLQRAWLACTHSLVFNFLVATPRCPAGSEGCIRRFDASAMLAWATQRTPLVSYRQDYLQGQDGTVVMRVG